MKSIILICLLALFPAILNAETYKWVNEEGVVTYSQSPPPEGVAERVKTYDGGSNESAVDSKSRLDRLRQKMADQDEDRELNRQSRQEMKQQAAIKKQNCQAARSNLQKLEGLGNRRYTIGGETKRLTETERQSLMEQAREQIKTNCGD